MTSDLPAPPIPDGWSEPERWAWGELTAGRPADFDKRYGSSLDPAEKTLWGADRRLSPDFIATTLKPPFSTSLQTDSVSFVGAWIDGGVSIGTVPHSLSFARTRIEHSVFPIRTAIGGSLSFTRVWVGGPFICHDMRVGDALFLSAVTCLEAVTLDGVQVAGPLYVTDDAIAQFFDKNAPAARSAFKQLAIENVTAASVHISELDADGIRCKELKTSEGVSIRDARLTDAIDFEHVRVEHELRVQTVTVGRITLDAIVVGREVEFSNTATSRLVIENAQVGGNLDITATLGAESDSQGDSECLSLEGTVVGGNVTLEVKVGGMAGLERMRVGGNLEMNRCTVTSYFKAAGSEIEGDLECTECVFKKPFDASLTNIGGNVRLLNSEVNTVTLAGSKISRDLTLGGLIERPLVWADDAMLDLHNAEVGAIADRVSFLYPNADPWPKEIDLRGFTFSKVVAFGYGDDRAAFAPEKLTEWLARDRSGSVQPYVQLAKVLRDSGELDKSNEILYAGREMARRRAWDEGLFLRWCGLSLLKSTIGYGLGTRYFRVLRWVGTFVLVGMVTLFLDQQLSHRSLTPESRTLSWMFFASVDALLPIVSLDKAFSDHVPASLTFFSKILFWILGLAGWVLASFLVAGLAGLTQKQS